MPVATKSLLTSDIKEVRKIGGRTMNRRVNGIESMFEEEGDATHCYVDRCIAGIIAKLAEKGMSPWTSCSGLACDHLDEKHPQYRAYFGIRTPTRMVMECIEGAGFRIEKSSYEGILVYAWPEDKDFRPLVPKTNPDEVLFKMWQSFAALIGAEFP